MAFNGTGSNVTSLNASNVASGTLAVARGGTGTASPSLVGGTNITISGTWPNQTVTAAGGGVTSLNGQTGAITDTSLYAIGSYVIGRPQNTTSYATDSTVAGNILYATQPLACVSRSSKGAFNWFFSDSGFNFGAVIKNLVNTGTWRCMGGAQFFSSGGTQNGTSGLWVRIS
jgi:hypothetical protein